MRAPFIKIWIFSGLKLETPMLLTRPLSTKSSMAAQVSSKGGSTSGPASSELGLYMGKTGQVYAGQHGVWKGKGVSCTWAVDCWTALDELQDGVCCSMQLLGKHANSAVTTRKYQQSSRIS